MEAAGGRLPNDLPQAERRGPRRGHAALAAFLSSRQLLSFHHFEPEANKRPPRGQASDAWVPSAWRSRSQLSSLSAPGDGDSLHTGAAGRGMRNHGEHMRPGRGEKKCKAAKFQSFLPANTPGKCIRNY